MARPFLRQLCILVVDSLYGLMLYIPLTIWVLNRAVQKRDAVKWDVSDVPDLDGKVVLVTGANAGIGYYTARALAAKGAKVYLGCRSESRAAAAIESLLRESPSVAREKLAWLRLDLSDQAQVVAAAKEVLAKEERLDVLVNNAGIDPYGYAVSKDGFEMTMAVNHIGHWTLTYCLLPLLQSTAARPCSDVRVITVSSSAHAMASPTTDFTQPSDLLDSGAPFPGWESCCLAQSRRYGTSKLANVLFARELQRRFGSLGIMSVSLNPGPVRTPGAGEVLPFLARPVVRVLFADPDVGALSSVYAAVGPRDDLRDAAYLDGPPPGRPTEPSERARDPVLARNLWVTTEAAVRRTGVLDGL